VKALTGIFVGYWGQRTLWPRPRIAGWSVHWCRDVAETVGAWENRLSSIREDAIGNQDEIRAHLDEFTAAVNTLRGELDAMRARLVRVEDSALESAAAIGSLRGDSSRTNTHVGELQVDHDRVKAAVWSHEESVRRLEALWSDAQRDMTSLAEALARLDGD